PTGSNLVGSRYWRCIPDRPSRAPFRVATELHELPAVAFGWPGLGCRCEIHSCPALFCNLEPQFAARFGFAVESLSHRRRAAHLTEKQDLDLEIATLGPDA